MDRHHHLLEVVFCQIINDNNNNRHLYSGGGGFSDDEEGRFDFSTATTNNDDNDGGLGGIGLGVSFRTDDGYRHALEFMQNNGYDEETINDFLLLDNVDYNEFRDMNVNEKVQSIKIKLELDLAHRQRVDQRINGGAENLLSRQYGVNNKLDDITRLTTELNTTTPIQPPITIREPTSTDPGEEDDPYRSVLIFDDSDDDDSDDDGGDDDDAAGAISTLPIVSNKEPKPPLVTLEEEEAYQCNYERELNRFSGNVLLLKDNVAAVSKFLRKAIKESPIEVARERERQQKQAELQQKLSAQFSPNAVSGRDAVDSHRAPEPQSRNNESAETSRYERQQVDSIDDVEQRLARNTDTGTIYGKTSVQLVVENSISRIQEEQTETMGGMLGATTGVRTIGNSITSNDYLDMCGVPTINDFQRLLDEQQRQHNTNLVDNTKLAFLSNEPMPNISQAPLGILPVNNHNRIIGAKPNMNDDEQVQIVDMEVDENLLITSEKNIQEKIGEAMEQENHNGNYALRLQRLATVKDRAKEIMRMLLNDAIQCGRLDQSMLANEEVIRISFVLLNAVEVILSQASSYFQSNRLRLINTGLGVEDVASPYYTLVFNDVPTMTMFEVSRNVFNRKMEPLIEEHF